MKNSTIVIAIALVFSLASCKQSQQVESEKIIPQNEAHHNSELYACPMHPEVQGKLDDKCSKCGMKLNEEVK